MIPVYTEIDITRKLRQSENYIPILILTARDDDDDESKLRGLDMGADDYLDKTVPMAEIIQRVLGLIRWHQQCDKLSTDTAKHSSIDSFLIDEKHKSVCVDGREIELTKREF